MIHMYSLKRAPISSILLYSLFISQIVALVTPSSTKPSPTSTTNVMYCLNQPDSRMPVGAWDSHLHVIDPVRYPLQPDAVYKVGTYTCWDATIQETRIGCGHMVLVQPSIYGYDNALLIDTLKAFGPERANGVVMFDVANTSAAQLAEWNDLGVRGVRLNFQSSGEAPSAKELKKMLEQYADAIRPFSWVLQLYIAMKDIPSIESVVPTLGVKVVFDHFGDPDLPKVSGCPQSLDLDSLTGFDSLLRLLHKDNSWVKVSGVYRLSQVPGPLYTDVDPIILELLQSAPSRLVYGSDWPHTRFEGLDIKPWTSHLLDLTEGKTEQRNKLFRDNAQELWAGGNKTTKN